MYFREPHVTFYVTSYKITSCRMTFSSRGILYPMLNFPLKEILKDVENDVTGIHFGYSLSGVDRALTYYYRVQAASWLK